MSAPKRTGRPLPALPRRGTGSGPAVTHKSPASPRQQPKTRARTSSTLFVDLFFHMKCSRPSSPFCRMIAPFVGSASTKFVFSRRKQRPALNAMRGSVMFVLRRWRRWEGLGTGNRGCERGHAAIWTWRRRCRTRHHRARSRACHTWISDTVVRRVK